MAKLEQEREARSTAPTPEEIERRAAGGWRLVAVEWQRRAAPAASHEAGTDEPAAGDHEVPFGLRVSGGGKRLEEDPVEREALALMLELITADETSLDQVASELNRRGFRTRRGSRWTQVAVFNMLPRLVESAPHIFSSEDWPARRERQLRSA